MEYKFNPEVELSDGERAALVHMTQMEGFRVLHRLMRSQVDTFIVDVINADPAKPADVTSKQVLAKAAGQFFQQVVDRINEETQLYKNAPRANDPPQPDATEGVLDFGNIAEQLEAVPNLLGGDESE